MLRSERWYRLHVAAALARLIGKLDHRNMLARMNQADPSAPSSTLVEDVDGAWALQDEDHQDAVTLTNFSLILELMLGLRIYNALVRQRVRPVGHQL